MEQLKKLKPRKKPILKGRDFTKGTDSDFSKKVEEQNKKGVEKANKIAKKAVGRKGGGMIYKDMGGLVGGQAKLDMNKDGMITGQDFKMMPKKYGGKITYRMGGGKVAGAGYDD